jgi:hypothetical protein
VQTFVNPFHDAGIAGTSATAMTESEALLAHTIDLIDRPTSAHFEYGLTDEHGSRVPAGGEAPGGSHQIPRAAMQPITRLQPGTTSHYESVRRTSSRMTMGPDWTSLTSSDTGLSPELTVPEGTPVPAPASTKAGGAGTEKRTSADGGTVLAVRLKARDSSGSFAQRESGKTIRPPGRVGSGLACTGTWKVRGRLGLDVRSHPKIRRDGELRPIVADRTSPAAASGDRRYLACVASNRTARRSDHVAVGAMCVSSPAAGTAPRWCPFGVPSVLSATPETRLHLQALPSARGQNPDAVPTASKLKLRKHRMTVQLNKETRSMRHAHKQFKVSEKVTLFSGWDLASTEYSRTLVKQVMS